MRAKTKCTICHPALFAENERRAIEPCSDHLREAKKWATVATKQGGLSGEEAVGDELSSMQYDAEWYGTPGLAEFFDRCEAAAFQEEAGPFMRRGQPSLSNYGCFAPHELYGIDDQAYAMSVIEKDCDLSE